MTVEAWRPATGFPPGGDREPPYGPRNHATPHPDRDPVLAERG